MKKNIPTLYQLLSFCFCSTFFFFSCNKGGDTPGSGSVTLPEFDAVTPGNQTYVGHISSGTSGSSNLMQAEVVSVLTGKAGLCAEQYGHVWSASQTEPTLPSSEGKTQLGRYCGDTLLRFQSNLTGLMPGKVYYARPYATYAARTVYGNTIRINVEAPKPEDERITLVKKWASKWALQDLTKIEPKIDYFRATRTTKETIDGEKEFTLGRVKSLDTLVIRFLESPKQPSAPGELGTVNGIFVLKSYPDLSADALRLEMTPLKGATKGTIVLRQTYETTNMVVDPITGVKKFEVLDIWKITFNVPR